MKTCKSALAIALGFLYSCGANQSPESASVEQEATKSGTQTEEHRQQADILIKDTMNAVQEETVRKPGLDRISDFEPFFEKFGQTIAQQDAETFNQLIDPELGLYIIETPGAVPHFTHLTEITKFKRPDAGQRAFFTIQEKFSNCQLKEVKTLPTITCKGEDNNFSQQGCFAADAAAFRKNEAYRYASLSPEEEKKAHETQLLVSKTVLHTNSGYRFHFGQVKGQWRVLFIDLSVPCSA